LIPAVGLDTRRYSTHVVKRSIRAETGGFTIHGRNEALQMI
jgi:hypothetical protein